MFKSIFCLLISVPCLSSSLLAYQVSPPKAKYVIVATGDFAVISLKWDECKAVAACVKLLVDSEQPVEVTQAMFRDKTHLVITYESSIGKITPTDIILGAPQADTQYPFVAEGKENTKLRRLVVAGDFCQPHPQSQPKSGNQPEGQPQARACATNLLIEAEDTRNDVSGYVYAADGSGYTPITVNSLQADTADISYYADLDFHPSWIVLNANTNHKKATATFPYLQAPASANATAVYRIEDLSKVCKPKTDPKNKELKEFDCPDLTTTPLTAGVIGEVEITARQRDLLFTRMRTFNGLMPQTMAVAEKGNKDEGTVARLLTKAASEQSELDVRLTVMDQETMRRNYGAGLAQQYVAVKIDLTNRTEKKLQFNKSAIWFDADFLETSSKYKERTRNKLSNGTFDIVEANVYDAPFATLQCADVNPMTKNETKRGCYKYRFGIEQSERFYPDGYLGILGSFDYVTQRTDRMLRIIELFGSTLTTIATGGAVAQVNNTAFRDAVSIWTGAFIPGSRAIVMNNAEINRERANLVAQTFQETVQIGPHGTVATIVLLPRDALINVQGAEKLVLLDRVLNVHIDPDVVNGVKDPPVPLGHLELGYTKAQVRQALGEAPSATTNTDGSSSFSYSDGPYQSVAFNAGGQALSWSPRSVADQLSLATTLEKAVQVLKANTSSGRQLILRDDSIILVNVPNVATVQHYDKGGKRIGTYTLLYDNLRSSGIGKAKSAFEALLGSMTLPSALDKATPVQQVAKNDTVAVYAMPDIKNGTVRVTFDAVLSKGDPKVKDVEFGGEKP